VIGNLGSSFTNVFVSPDLSTNLISVGQLVEENCSLHFDQSDCCVQDQVSGQEIAKGPKVGRLFPLKSFSIPRSIYVGCFVIANNNSHFWHKKLSHPNSIILTHLMKHGYLSNTNEFSSLSFDCAPCKLGKNKSLPFPLQGSRASTCFEIIHYDVWGMSPVLSHAQFKYFVTFIDDYSRFTWVYFLRSKADVFSNFKTFVTYVETQFFACIKPLRSNCGGEYMSHAFQSFLQQKGILSQHSCPYTPQQNGVAERKNRHLLDVVCTLMLESSVPPRFWVKASSTAVYLINRLPSPTLHLDSPYSRLFGVPPNYNSLHVFCCVCFVHLPPIERHKLPA
jgi:transposase InsO family protein